MYELKDREFVFVFTGPDGAGRKTVADQAGATLGMKKVVSCATRKPRPGEVNGHDYHFISHELYEQMERQQEFLESIRIGANRYGIRELDVARSFETHGCIYVIVNRQGADILKRLYGERTVRLFINADRETVAERQRKKGLDEAVVGEHLARYERDLAYRRECEHAFENSDLAHTVWDVTNTLERYLKRGLVERD